MSAHARAAAQPGFDRRTPGDALILWVNGAPLDTRAVAFNGQAVAGPQAIRWTGHGDRWELEAGTRYLYMLPIIMASR